MILTANTLEAAMQDALDLVPWAEPNADALNWEPLDEAVRAALSGPVPADYPWGVPLLRFASGGDAIPLVDALLAPPVPRPDAEDSDAWFSCDVSPLLREDLRDLPGAHQTREPSTLWVPCGASVVQVTMRNSAADLLQDVVGTHLVWCD